MRICQKAVLRSARCMKWPAAAMAPSMAPRPHSSPPESRREHAVGCCGALSAKISLRRPSRRPVSCPTASSMSRRVTRSPARLVSKRVCGHGALGAVVAEVARLSMTASRRLQLAAEGSGAIGIAVRRWRRQRDTADFGQPTASVTRWRVSALPSSPLPVPGVDRARWQLELIRCRAGESADLWRLAMRRVVSLWLPTWPTDRVRRNLGAAAPPAEAPLVLIGREGRRRVVPPRDAAAGRAGLRVGVAATKAQALVPGLIVQDADPIADGEALDRLALWALQRYAPIVAADPPDGLVIDTTGADHLHGGEEAMVKAMVERLAASGFAARAGLHSWGAAHAIARYLARPVFVAPKGDSARAILNLPIAALRLAGEMAESLRTLGFDRIGELVDKPRAPLARAGSPASGRRLDQAMGRISEPIDPGRPPRSYGSAPRVRRTDRSRGNHCALHRQTGRPALRHVGGKRPWREAS